jgi:hypothetical protein
MRRDSIVGLSLLGITQTACDFGRINSPVEPLNEASADTTPVNLDPAFKLSDRQIIDLYSTASCDSMTGTSQLASGENASEFHRGLRGKVIVPPAQSDGSQTTWRNLNDYDQGIELDSTLYFSQLNVPTRAFTEGFPTFDGSLIEDSLGNDLVEFFRIDFTGNLTSPAGSEGGLMEFAVLADDGIRVSVDGEQIIEYTGVTPTKMVCGTSSVYLEPGQPLPIEVNYFQGPRHHIALMLLWRPAGQSPDPLCGRASNEAWFDYRVSPTVAKADYLSLVDRGWQVVGSDNFSLPSDELLNPCTSQRVQDVFANQ